MHPPALAYRPNTIIATYRYLDDFIRYGQSITNNVYLLKRQLSSTDTTDYSYDINTDDHQNNSCFPHIRNYNDQLSIST